MANLVVFFPTRPSLFYFSLSLPLFHSYLVSKLRGAKYDAEEEAKEKGDGVLILCPLSSIQKAEIM